MGTGTSRDPFPRGVWGRLGEVAAYGGGLATLDADDIPVITIPPNELALYLPYDSGSIYASRGCTGTCSFCTVSRFWKRSYRTRVIDDIIDELMMYAGAGFRSISFKDENFLLDPTWSMDLLGEIERLKLGIQIKIKSRLDLVNRVAIERLLGAGVTEVQIGVEDVSLKVIADTHKYDHDFSRKALLETFYLIQEAGINANPIFIFGLKGTNTETLCENIEFIKTLHDSFGIAKIYFTFLAPQPLKGKYDVRDDYVLLNRDLDYFTHLFPVATPKSLGKWEEACKVMVQCYEEVVTYTGSVRWNPLISADYLQLLELNEEHHLPILSGG